MKQTLEQCVSNLFERVCERFDIPESLKEDTLQEVALATLEGFEKFKELPSPTGRVHAHVYRRIERFLKIEKTYSETEISEDPVYMSGISEEKSQMKDAIEYTARNFTECLRKVLELDPKRDNDPHYRAYRARFHVMITLIESRDVLTERDLMCALRKETGLSTTRVHQIYEKMLRMCRCYHRLRHLYEYRDNFNIIRDILSV